MKTPSLIKYALIGASLPLFAGCVEHEVVYEDHAAPPPHAAGPEVIVEGEVPPPPPPQAEVKTIPPGPMSEWYWAQGCWEWNGQWAWTRGYWIRRPFPSSVWVAAHWEVRHDHRVWMHGHWR
jgi:hypothetical protein